MSASPAHLPGTGSPAFTPKPHQPIIVQAHAAAGNVILRGIVDRQAVLLRQSPQILVVPDIGIPLVKAIVIVITPAEARVEDGWRIADAVVMPGLAPRSHR